LPEKAEAANMPEQVQDDLLLPSEGFMGPRPMQIGAVRSKKTYKYI
jgi:hypothetical protein